jgi:hypothetical protein
MKGFTGVSDAMFQKGVDQSSNAVGMPVVFGKPGLLPTPTIWRP